MWRAFLPWHGRHLLGVYAILPVAASIHVRMAELINVCMIPGLAPDKLWEFATLCSRIGSGEFTCLAN